MVTTFTTVLVVIGVIVGVLIYLRNKGKPANRFDAIPTEERNAQLEAKYQAKKAKREQQPPTETS